MNLRLSSYNIRLCLEQGVDAVAHEIRSLAPDIIALQEVGMFWRMGPPGDLTQQLAARSGLRHHIFVPALYHEDGAYGIALYPNTRSWSTKRSNSLSETTSNECSLALFST